MKRVDNIVPMKMLLIDYVWDKVISENEGFDINMKNFVTSKLQAILKEEIEKHRICRTEMKHIKYMCKELEYARIIHCGQFCPNRELVNIYAHCKTCQEMNNKTSSKGGYRKKRKKFYNVYFCVLCAVEHQKKILVMFCQSHNDELDFDRLIKLMRQPKLNCLTRELHDQIKFKCLPPQDEDSDVLIQKNAASEEENTHVNMCAMGKAMRPS